MAAEVSEAKALATKLQSDRLIKIYVGEDNEDTKPFLVQQSTLESASDYIAKALGGDAFLEGREGCLRFPEDDLEAWEVFLFWPLKNRVPDCLGPLVARGSNSMPLCVRCWAFGDRYGVVSFQDEIMLRLIHYLSVRCTTLDVIKLAFETTMAGSHLRRIMAEEASYLYDQGKMSAEDFDLLDGVGFMSEFIRAQRDWDGGINRLEHRESALEGEECRWRSYMVGDGPEKHPLVGDDL